MAFNPDVKVLRPELVLEVWFWLVILFMAFIPEVKVFKLELAPSLFVKLFMEFMAFNPVVILFKLLFWFAFVKLFKAPIPVVTLFKFVFNLSVFKLFPKLPTLFAKLDKLFNPLFASLTPLLTLSLKTFNPLLASFVRLFNPLVKLLPRLLVSVLILFKLLVILPNPVFEILEVKLLIPVLIFDERLFSILLGSILISFNPVLIPLWILLAILEILFIGFILFNALESIWLVKLFPINPVWLGCGKLLLIKLTWLIFANFSMGTGLTNL